MSFRGKNPEKHLIERVFEIKGDDWSDSTRKVAHTDAIRLLEALVAEFGLEGSMQALRNQGFKSDSYGYLLRPLLTEAVARRERARHQETAETPSAQPES